MKSFYKRRDPVEMIILLLGGFLVVMLAFFMARGDLDAYTQLLLKGEAVEETTSPVEKPNQKDDQMVTIAADISQKGLIVEEENQLYQEEPKETVAEIPSVATPPPAKPKPTSSPSQPPPSGNYYLQVGAFSSQNNADKMVALLKEMGYGATVEKSSNLFKVKVFGFTSKPEASNAVQKMKTKGIDAFIGQ